jgi:hypothetical protein
VYFTNFFPFPTPSSVASLPARAISCSITLSFLFIASSRSSYVTVFIIWDDEKLSQKPDRYIEYRYVYRPAALAGRRRLRRRPPRARGAGLSHYAEGALRPCICVKDYNTAVSGACEMGAESDFGERGGKGRRARETLDFPPFSARYSRSALSFFQHIIHLFANCARAVSLSCHNVVRCAQSVPFWLQTPFALLSSISP